MGDGETIGENRSRLQDQISNLFSQGLAHPELGGIQHLLGQMSLPSYGGQLSAGMNPLQQQVLSLLGGQMQGWGAQQPPWAPPRNFPFPQQPGGPPTDPNQPIPVPFPGLPSMGGGSPMGIGEGSWQVGRNGRPVWAPAPTAPPTPDPAFNGGQVSIGDTIMHAPGTTRQNMPAPAANGMPGLQAPPEGPVPPPGGGNGMPGTWPAPSQFGGPSGGMSNAILQQLFGYSQNGGGMGPQGLLQSLGNPQGMDILAMLAGGGGPGQQNLQMGTGPNGANSLLAQLAQGGGPNFAALQGMLGQGMGTSPLDQIANAAPGITSAASQQLLQMAQGGGAPDFQSAFSAIDNARRAGLDRDVRDLREQFSYGGNRFSSDLANAIGTRQSESEATSLGQMAQLALQSAGQIGQNRLGAGQSLAQLGLGSAQGFSDATLQQRQQNLSGAGQLGQLQLGQFGQVGNILGMLQQGQGQDLNRLLQAGQFQQGLAGDAAGQMLQGSLGGSNTLAQLFQGQQGRQLQAMMGLPGSFDMLNRLPGDLAQQAFGIGGQAQGLEQAALDRQMQEYMRTYGGLFWPTVNYAAGSPVIQQPGMLNQIMGAGTTLGAAALGAK